MTAPFQFPNIQQGQTIMDPGTGGAIASALAQVLAAQQQQRENEFRQQQLAQAQAQQQALAQYYQGTLGVQNRQEDRLDATARSETSQRAQVGGAMRRALPGQPAQQPGQVTPPAQQRGNFTQDPNAGVFKQVLGGGSQALAPAAGSPDIFGGVSDENIPAAVQGVQEVNKLQPKPEELPTSGKEFEYLKRLAARDPQQALLYKQLFLDKQPTTVINNIPAKGATKFSETLGEEQAKFLIEGEKQAKVSAAGFPAMSEAYGLVDKSFTGFGANQLLSLARMAGATGFKPSKDRVADTQTMVKLLREQTLAYLQTRALGSGTAVSDKDREFMERMSGADLTLDPAAIKRIIRVNTGTTVMRMQEAINDLRDQAISYPENARVLTQKAEGLQRRLGPIWSRYADMLKAEDDTVSRIKQVLGR